MAAPSEGSLLRGAAPKLVISLLIGAGFAWLLGRGGLPLLPPRELLARTPALGYAGYVALIIVGMLLRTYRWNYLIRPLDPSARPFRVMGMGLIGFSAIFLLPLRSGEIVRPYLMARDKRVSFMQAAGTVGAERVIDGLVLTLFTFVALATATQVSPLPRSLGDLPLPIAAVPPAVYSALLVFASAFVVMTGFYVARARARSITERVIGLVSPRAGVWAADTLDHIASGLSFLPSKGNLLRFVADTLAYWGAVIAAQLLLLRALGLDASLSQAATTVGVQGLGTVVPAGPGMFGAFQIASFSGLAMFFPMQQVKVEGALFIFLTYTTQVVLSSVQFIFGFLLLAKVPQRAAPAAAEAGGEG